MGIRGLNLVFGKTPETIFTAFRGYISLCLQNPINDKIPRPLTVRGFCMFACVSASTYYHSLNNPVSEDMKFAMEIIHTAIVNQKV